MKHAFLITAYKDPEQLCYLIDELLKYDSNVYIHVDKRSSDLKTQITLKYSFFKNVNILSSPLKVHFGGYSHLKAILCLIDEAFQDPSNSYFHSLSGQDFPVRTKNEFEVFFESNKDKDFLTWFQLPVKQWDKGGLDRMEYYHLNDIIDPKKDLFEKVNRRFFKVQDFLKIKRKKPSYISSYYGGGTWWSMSRRAINTVMDFQKVHPDYIRYFKHTHCGEEIFFQTILLNSDKNSAPVNNDLRYINWEPKNGSCPAILDLNDLHGIYNKECFFARKFDSEISNDLRKKILSKTERVMS